MPARVRARYANGVLTPLDPVDLREGVEVAIAIETAQPETPSPADADERHRQMPDDASADTPTDLVKDQRRNRFSMTRQEKQNLLNEIPSLARVAARIKEFEQREQEPPPDGKPQGLAWIAARVKEMHRQMPDDAWDDVPTDFATNKDHYLYGDPKAEDE